MLQTTPLAVIATPPFEVIIPPVVAVVVAIFDTPVVVKVGISILKVVKLTSVPYAVPAALVA